MGEPMSDRAVYLGGGVWWQLTERQRAQGVGHGLPERIRPVQPFAVTATTAQARVALARRTQSADAQVTARNNPSPIEDGR